VEQLLDLSVKYWYATPMTSFYKVADPVKGCIHYKQKVYKKYQLMITSIMNCAWGL